MRMQEELASEVESQKRCALHATAELPEITDRMTLCFEVMLVWQWKVRRSCMGLLEGPLLGVNTDSRP